MTGSGTSLEARHPAVHEALAAGPLIDGHNDLAWSCRRHRAYSVDGLAAGADDLHTDLDRLRRGGVGAQFWSVFAETDLVGGEAVQYTLEQVDFVRRLIARYPDDLEFAWSAADVRRIWSEGRIASLLGAEGGHSLGGSLAVLRVLRDLGVRYLTLTHNRTIDVGDSATDAPQHGGLSDFGRDVVAESNRLGMLVDLSHVAATTMNDALDVTRAPVVFSHSSCRAVTDHPRNVPDDVLRRLETNGGVVMVSFVPSFVSATYAAWRDAGRIGRPPLVTIDEVADHVDHAREVAGIDHIGLGSDYDGFLDFPSGMEDVRGFAALLDVLAGRGWSAADLTALAGGNVLRVLDAADAVADPRP